MRVLTYVENVARIVDIKRCNATEMLVFCSITLKPRSNMLRATSNLLPRNMLRWCKRGLTVVSIHIPSMNTSFNKTRTPPAVPLTVTTWREKLDLFSLKCGSQTVQTLILWILLQSG